MPSVFDSDAFNGALFFPRADRSPPPPGAEDRFVEVEGARLHLRLHGPPRPVLLLLFHGNGEVVADYDEAAPRFAAEVGAQLAVVDYRGYGQSTGRPTLRALLADARPVLEAVTGRGQPVVVMGRSLGGAAAAELCQQARPGVIGHVFESAASDLDGVVARRGLSARLDAADRAVFDPLPKLARCTTPALVLHGEQDTLIRFDEAVRTHAALPGAELVPIAGLGHNDLSFHPRYWQALGAFVGQALRRAGAG